MGAEEITITINPFLLFVLTAGGFSLAIWVIYQLLMYVSKLTIDGIYHKIDECQSDLKSEISTAYDHAEGAHRRAGRLENSLMSHGVANLGAK